MFSGCLYSAEKNPVEKKGRPRKPTPPRYIPFEKRNNDIYVLVNGPIKATPIGIRYFTLEEGCAPGYYFETETITPLANIRNNPYWCLVKRQQDETSLLTFTYQSSSKVISVEPDTTLVVHPEDNKKLSITKKGSDSVVAQFTIQ